MTIALLLQCQAQKRPLDAAHDGQQEIKGKTPYNLAERQPGIPRDHQRQQQQWRTADTEVKLDAMADN